MEPGMKEPPELKHRTLTDTSKKRHRTLGWLGKGLIAFSALGLVLTGFFGDIWYLANAAFWVHFYFIFAAIGVACCVRSRARIWAGLGLACVLTATALMIPGYCPAPNRAAHGQKANLRVLQANVYDRRHDASALLALIKETSPDIILLQEVNREWQTLLKPLETMYPYKAFFPRAPGGTPDLAQYWRVDSETAQSLAESGLPAMKTTLVVNGRPICLVNAHTAAPFTTSRALRYQKQMKALTDYMRAIDTPAILSGDLNACIWSHPFQRLQKIPALVDVRQGLGILGTWPSFFGPLRTALDHILVSRDIKIVHAWVGPGIGSDHRPLLADLYVPPLTETKESSKLTKNEGKSQ